MVPQWMNERSANDIGKIAGRAWPRDGGRVHGRMRQACLHLLEPLRDVDMLAKALGLDN